MSGWVEILLVAFVAQLTVLPGEKGQFVVAALSTRYDPLVVVSAAATAFAGWTALEIALGQALRDALPPLATELVTGALFLVFAVLLWRSAPEGGDGEDADAPTGTDGAVETDGAGAAVPGTETDADLDLPTVLGRDLSTAFGGFVPIFLLMAAGEFGDKTQLVTIGLAVQYGAHPAIWAGEMLAIVPVSLANAYVFHRFAHRFDLRRAHRIAAVLFAFFALDTGLGIVTGFSVWEAAVGGVTDAVLALL